MAGSTHEGEEEAVFLAYAALQRRFPGLCLILAPRHPERGAQVTELAQSVLGWRPGRRSLGQGADHGVLILDTLGELASCYPLADMAFIGGSLVPEGGHNPLEATRHGLPVVFGPHMEDFCDLARDLLSMGAAREVHGLTGWCALAVNCCRQELSARASAGQLVNMWPAIREWCQRLPGCYCAIFTKRIIRNYAPIASHSFPLAAALCALEAMMLGRGFGALTLRLAGIILLILCITNFHWLALSVLGISGRLVSGL